MAVTKYAMPFKVSQGEWSGNTAETINNLFERLFKVVRIGADALDSVGALANGLDVISPSPGDMIVCTSAGIFIALSLVSTSQRVLTNNGGTPTWALLNLANGVTGVLPFANLTNATATQRVLGRNTAGAGVWEEVTATQLIDWIGAVRGDVLYRNATTWVALAPGTSGQLLQTGGAGADPSWVTPGATSGVVDFINQNELRCSGRLASPFYIAWGHTGPTVVVGTPTDTGDSTGTYIQNIQGGTTVDLRCGFDAARRDFFRADSDPTLEFVIKTGATMTNIRLWFGMFTAQITSADNQGGATQYIAFRYSTVAGDGGWVGVTRDGTTQSVTGTVAAIAASTVYKLKIRKSGSSVFFSVNGGAEVSTSSNLPAAATTFGIDGVATNAVAGATHPFSFSRYRCYYGS